MKCGAGLVVVLMGLTPARAAEQSTGTVVRAIQIVEDGDITRVTIDADGPLPLPVSERLNDPPRIFFDFAGVTHKIGATITPPGSGVVRRVRVALRSASPRVTRVVLDLARLDSYRVNTEEHQAGRIRVLVGSESAIGRIAAARAAVPSAPAPGSANISSSPVVPRPSAGIPAPPKPAASSTPAMVAGPVSAGPVRPPAIAGPSPPRSPVLSPEASRPALPILEIATYRKQISSQMFRMVALRAIVARIDAGENVDFDTLASAAQEFSGLRRSLESVMPSAVLKVTHDLIMTSCTLGATASRLGIEAAREGNQETRQRAASAAAGSMMLFDRACADLGCSRPLR